MSCDDYRKLILLYPELDAEERADIDRHLQSCAECRALYREQRELSRLLRSYAGREKHTGTDISEPVMRSLSSVERGERRRLVPLYPIRHAMAAASFALIFFFVQESMRGTVIQGHRTPGVLATSTAPVLTSPTLPGDAGPSAFADNRGYKSNRWSLYECLRQCADRSQSGCESCSKKFEKMMAYENE